MIRSKTAGLLLATLLLASALTCALPGATPPSDTPVAPTATTGQAAGPAPTVELPLVPTAAGPSLTTTAPTQSPPATVGLPPTPTAASPSPFGPITFCEDVTDDGVPVRPGTTFAGGSREVWALFSYQDMRPGTPWRREWTRDGQTVAQVDDEWEWDATGWIAYPMMEAVGLQGGTYTFSLYVQGQIVQRASFDVDPLPAAVLEILNRAAFGPITFCQDVTDDGDPVGPATSFAGDTTAVWALFTHEDLTPGQPWGRLWEHDGQVYVDATDEVWEDEADSWMAYSLYDEDGLEEGHYTLTLFIGDRQVRQASFDVASSAAPRRVDSPAFGAITFAQGVTEDWEPVGPTAEFDAGTTEVYAVFVYLNMTDGQAWSREWLLDGERLVRKDLEWDEGDEGSTYCFFSEDEGLEPGLYTLNLYIGDQLARSADFTVAAPPVQPPPTARPPARPEDVVDADLLPAWNRLAACQNEFIQDAIQLVLKHHVRIFLDSEYSGRAAYRYSCTTPPVPGEIVVSRKYWSETDWDRLTATLAHEMTHLYQHLSGNYPCGCTIEKEYWAVTVQLYTLRLCQGRRDLMLKYYSWAYDSSGRYSTANVWRKVREVYRECREK